MIAIAKPYQPAPVPAWHGQFLAMVPAIAAHASVCFSSLDREAREDLVQEVLANCLVAYVRLVELGKADLAYPAVLARYAVAQVRHGRRVGSSLNSRDVSSAYAQWRQGIAVDRLDESCGRVSGWKEIVVEDRRATPADTAACRIDFQEWLRRLPLKQRRVAKLLATGEQSSVVAMRLGLTAGRISQLRRELKESWEAFQSQANNRAA